MDDFKPVAVTKVLMYLTVIILGVTYVSLGQANFIPILPSPSVCFLSALSNLHF